MRYQLIPLRVRDSASSRAPQGPKGLDGQRTSSKRRWGPGWLLTLTIFLLVQTLAATPTLTLAATLAPDPSTGQTVVTLGPSVTAAQFLADVQNMNIDVIQLQAGTYSFTQLIMDVDRTARPLTIEPAPGATVVFSGSAFGVPNPGGFPILMGTASTSAYITIQDITFTGYTLNQSGVFGFAAYAHNITLNGLTFENLTSGSGVPYHDWAVYMGLNSTAPHDITIENCTVIGTAYNVSAFQADSSAAIYNITVTGCSFSGVYYAFYGSTQTGLTLSDLTVNSSNNGFYVATGSTGTYSDINAPGIPHSMGSLTDGGGNTW